MHQSQQDLISTQPPRGTYNNLTSYVLSSSILNIELVMAQAQEIFILKKCAYGAGCLITWQQSAGHLLSSKLMLQFWSLKPCSSAKLARKLQISSTILRCSLCWGLVHSSKKCTVWPVQYQICSQELQPGDEAVQSCFIWTLLIIYQASLKLFL